MINFQGVEMISGSVGWRLEIPGAFRFVLIFDSGGSVYAMQWEPQDFMDCCSPMRLKEE
jgi:hypothetical protein